MKDRQPALVSVVIPAYNAVPVIADQLDALARQSYSEPFEVIVVDNRSQDGTASFAASRTGGLRDLRVVDASAAAGAAHARNVGARAARGDLIAFCDSDDVADGGWLAALVEAARDADAVAGSIDHETLNDPRSRAWRSALQTNELPVLGDFLPYAMTANCGIWSDVFHAIGGFDEGFGSASEDVDFFWRLQMAGFRLAFAPAAVVQYRHRADMRDLARQHYRYGLAEAYCYRKYRDSGMPSRSVRRALKDWRNMITRGPRMWRDPLDRGVWLRLVAYRAGYVSGSIKARVLYV